jgi:ABC-2 type transport system permease protein
MKRLIKAELLKLISTRSTYALVFGAATAALVTVAIGILRAGHNGVPSLGTFTNLRRVITNSGGVGTLFALVLGVTAVAGEFRHRTAASTFIASPRRLPVVVAKMLAYPLFGLMTGAAAITAGLAVVMMALSASGYEVASTFNAAIAGVAASWVLGAGLYCLVGVGLGALMRNQMAAVIVALAWPQVIENIIHDISWLYRWAPGGASSALVRADVAGLLPPWGGALLLLGYGLVLGLIGSAAVVRRDVG